jgi:parvulin-like peptidyl-prolyl isomerase
VPTPWTTHRDARHAGVVRALSRRLGLVAAVLLLPAALAGCGGGGDSKEVPPNAAALVGDEPITRAALASIVRANRQVKGAAFPPAGSRAFRNARNRLLDELVEEAELEQRARSQFKIEIDDAQVEQQLDELRTRTGSKARFRRALAQQGLTETLARARIRQQLLGEAVFARLSEQASVSDEEIERYYRNHRKGYDRPAARQVRHILVATRAQADAIERKLKAGADFGALARRYSIDSETAASGGVLPGGAVRGETLPEFEAAAFSLHTNEISPPVRTQQGWHIIQATSDVTPGRTTPLSEVRSTIRAALLASKRESALPRWARETRREYAKRVVYASGFGPSPDTPTG